VAAVPSGLSLTPLTVSSSEETLHHEGNYLLRILFMYEIGPYLKSNVCVASIKEITFQTLCCVTGQSARTQNPRSGLL
jgi:hypothetical protein